MPAGRVAVHRRAHRRRAAPREPDADYGHMWTDRDRPAEQWSVSWNVGTGELYAFDRATGDVDVLVRYDTAATDVHEALDALAVHALQADRITWLRRRTAPGQARPPTQLYGVVACADGRLGLRYERR